MLYITLSVCALFVFLIAVARRRNLICGAPFIYNFALVFFYAIVVFVVMPLSDNLAQNAFKHGVSLFGSARDLSSDLKAWKVADERKFVVVAAYSFTIVWFYIATILMAGLAIGFGNYEIKISYKETEGQAIPGWGWVAFTSTGVIIVSMLVLPDLASSPMEPVGSRCLRNCNWLNLGIFPYFGKFILLGLGWNIFIYIFLFNLTWKIAKGSFMHGD